MLTSKQLHILISCGGTGGHVFPAEALAAELLQRGHRLALVTDPIFNRPHAYPAITLVIGVIFFAFEIFCDFSGYSNIALGAARVMGYKLMVNFNWPYSSKSVSEFWRRWHISLSTWFNDYLYTPLAMSYRNLGIFAVVIASIVTFLTSGLWHGAAWTYIVWGALHGLALTYEVLTKKTRKKIFKKIPKRIGDTIGMVCTFSYVCFTYIFFRANSMKDALYIAGRLPAAAKEILMMVKTRGASLQLPIAMPKFMICVAVIALLQLIYNVQKRWSLNALFESKPIYVRWGVYYLFVFMIIYMGVFQNRQFIYFQF